MIERNKERKESNRFLIEEEGKNQSDQAEDGRKEESGSFACDSFCIRSRDSRKKQEDRNRKISEKERNVHTAHARQVRKERRRRHRNPQRRLKEELDYSFGQKEQKN